MSAEDLQALLDLQAVDTSLDQHRHRRATLAERATIADADNAIARVKSALDGALAERDEVASRQEALETELATAERRSQEVSRRLYGGEVAASRELQAMSAELDALKSRASGIEDRLLEVLEEREPLDARVSEHESDMARLQGDRDAGGAALARAESIVDAEIAELEETRVGVAARVPEPLLAEYERLRARLGGIAVSRLVGDRCDGCHLTLPATELDRIRHLPSGEMVTCDQCGRILVPAPSGKLD
jgi:predicted  nucleic acid-binding Zn-ribbon protein